MKNRTYFKILAGVLVLMFAALACGEDTSEVTPTNQPEPIEQKSAPANSGEKPNELSREQKSKLAHSTVRIWGVRDNDGQFEPLYHGSGSIITPDGYILTNCHVADPVAMGYSPDKYSIDGLVIDIIETEDKPPVATYLAKTMTEDPVLDLAVIKIVSNLDGSKLDNDQLNLPWVQIGNSDNVNFGDRIYIFGFPSIGGDTITYSTGDISGFDSEDPVGNRAWIKTEATIAGGNSGGLAAGTDGKIIGIPTQVGTGSATKVTDCRFIQDTNGDGEVNENDTCIPTGGFINGVRPVNWATQLIQSARNGVAYKSPYDQPAVEEEQPVQPTGGTDELTFEGWSTKVNTDSNCPVNPIESFPSGTMKVISGFSSQNMQEGTTLNYNWKINGRETAKGKFDWAAGVTCNTFSLDNAGKALPDGDYSLDVYANGQTIARAVTSIGGDGGSKQDEGVTFSGIVTDADTGDPIADVSIVVLKPGIDPDEWRKTTSDKDIYSYTKTNRNGEYQLPKPLMRGSTYGVVVGNKKLGYGVKTGTVKILESGGNTFDLPVELSK